MKAVWRAGSVLAFALSLASCGGGGGGDSGGGSAGVAFQHVNPISVQLMEGATMPSQPVSLLATGNVASLNGQTLYLLYDDPSSLFQPSAFVSLSQNPVGANMTLSGRTLDTPGHYQGNVTVHACLDIACANELGGSPLVIPYDVTVLPGMVLDRQSIAVTVPFGQVPSVQTVNVTLPQYLTSWGASVSTPYDALNPSRLSVANSTGSGSVTGTVSLTLDAAPAGTYVETAKVFTNVFAPDGISRHYEKTITVTYTVTPDASADYVFNPAAGSYVRTYGDNLFAQVSRSLVTNTGVTATWRGIEYLSNPVAANGHPQVNSWWSEYPYLGTSTCYNTVGTSDCLPMGTYTARVHYTMTKGGVDTEVYWPITLQIVP